MDSAGLVADFPALSRLTADELQQLSATASPARFAARERIFSEDQAAEGCWLIHSGQVALDIHIPGRGLVVVQTLGPCDLLGWSWLVPPYRWHFGATAAEPTVTTALDTARLRRLAEADPAFGYALSTALLSAMLQRLQATRSRLLDLYQSPRDQH